MLGFRTRQGLGLRARQSLGFRVKKESVLGFKGLGCGLRLKTYHMFGQITVGREQEISVLSLCARTDNRSGYFGRKFSESDTPFSPPLEPGVASVVFRAVGFKGIFRV